MLAPGAEPARPESSIARAISTSAAASAHAHPATLPPAGCRGRRGHVVGEQRVEALPARSPYRGDALTSSGRASLYQFVHKGGGPCPRTLVQEDRAVVTDVSDDQVDRFRTDGFLILEEGFLPDDAIEILRERSAALFEGDYATGIAPDEVNWKQGRDPQDRTRQICNGWRSDDLIAAQVLSERTGRIAARLDGLAGHARRSGQLPLEAPGRTCARHAPGRLLRRVSRAPRDDHLLGARWTRRTPRAGR